MAQMSLSDKQRRAAALAGRQKAQFLLGVACRNKFHTGHPEAPALPRWSAPRLAQYGGRPRRATLSRVPGRSVGAV